MSRELDLRDIFRIIQKRIWLIVLIMVLICSLVGVYSVFIKKPVFEASTKIVVNQTPSSSTVNQLDLNQINTNIQLINTYKEVIKTPAILDRVVKDYPEFQLTAEDLSRMVNVNSVNNTQVMTVVVRDLTYVKAAEIANAISKVFKDEIPTIFNVQNVSILNEAKTEPSVRPQPVEPNITLNLMIGFIVSLMAGVGLSFVLEYLDDTIKTEEDVKEFLEMPTLAMITKVNHNEQESSQSYTTSMSGGKDHVTIAK
ncbi:YveK family protein [Paenibacillus gallinarum]|uniref:Lipopolysaccharide biosynthesis protein n=1 Tax=Paenibacillus gallinarum TaxID=2762232 RepID=A0ABR8T483_9BACL|nr:Wzz/FepE/Etk N-terminal domain-containing protein [Paenibacillus gallinarum]MBD7970562.1 lipopolysaccharide biosynthesis protein [Paenibacillus gallinarum]